MITSHITITSPSPVVITSHITITRPSLVVVGTVVVVIAWELDLQLPIYSVPIPTKAVSSNPVLCKVFLIHCVMKFVSDLRQVGGFLSGYSAFLQQEN